MTETRKLMAKAWRPVYCSNNHVVALTIRPVYVGGAASAYNYVGIQGTVRRDRLSDGSLSNYYWLRCDVCGETDAMWNEAHNFVIRTDKEAKHGKN